MATVDDTTTIFGTAEASGGSIAASASFGASSAFVGVEMDIVLVGHKFVNIVSFLVAYQP